MAFASTDHDLDLESQYISSPLRLVRGPGMCPPPTGWNPPETEGIFKFAFRDIPRLEVDTAQPTFPLATEIHPADTAVHAPGQAGQVKDQAEPPDTESGLDPSSASNNQSAESSPGKDISKPESQDFDSGANTLWTLFKNETQSHDEARIQRLKDDMDGVLIFAGLFSAALTSFIIDSKGNLKVNPADQMVYYLQQNVAMLAQISTQISSIAPQIIIPSSLPPPYPAFNASSSDIRVNAFWFMSLIFSLSAALLAILVQQWVRNYMHVFQRYSDPLKSARLRQYLHEGSEKWYMPVVAEALPGLLHVSLFLFFVGLGDFVLNINITVGQSTIVPIGLCGSLYVFAIFAPVMYPQSPYQNSFSGLVWYLVQRLHGRKYKDRDGSSKSVSANMSQGQMQLAMEETNERMKRDQEAIRWLVDNLTEETEMESLVAAIPGSFNAKWGRDVWKRVSEETQGEDKVTNGNRHAVVPLAKTNIANPTSLGVSSSLRPNAVRSLLGLRPSNGHHHTTVVPSHSQGETVIRELSRRIAHLLETCKTRGLFASPEQWRKRARTCIESTAVLACCANAEPSWFEDAGRVLGDIGNVEKMGELLSTDVDSSFVIHWTCLSIMVTRSKLNNESTRDYARGEIRRLQWKQGTGIKFELALKKAKWVDDFLDEALNWLSEIHATFFEERTLMDVQNLTGEKIREILRNDKPKIIELVKIYNIIDPDQLQYKVWTDGFLDMIDTVTHGITRQLPGLHSRIPSEPTVLIPFSQFLDLFRDPHKSLLIPVQQVFKRVCCFVSSFRAILEEKHSRETTNFVLEALNDVGELIEKSRFTNLLQRYLWRLQDLYDGGGLGFTVELFFLALKPLLSSSSSQESQSTIYIGTFRTITSDWAKYKHSIGTQKILLDAITSRRGILREFRYPLYITEEFLDLLGNVLHEQKGTHIDAAVEELNNNIPWHDPIDSYYPDAFWKRVLDVVSRSRTAVPAPPFS